MTWIFVSVIIVSAGYLMYMIIAFLNRLSVLKPRIELLEREIAEQEAEGDKYELATLDTELKIRSLEEEALRHERKISDLQLRINAQTKKGEKAEASEQKNQNVQPGVR